MNLKFQLGWVLCVLISLGHDIWALEDGSPIQREARWQALMEQGKRDREQRRLADAEQNFLAAVSAAEQFEAGDTRVRGKPERTGNHLSPTGPLHGCRGLLPQGSEPLGVGFGARK